MFGYARISAREQKMQELFPEPMDVSLEDNVRRLTEIGCDKIFSDVWKGTLADCPNFETLCQEIHPGDTLVIPDMGHIAFSEVRSGDLVRTWLRSGVQIWLLDDDTGKIRKMPSKFIANDTLMFHLFFANFEYMYRRYIPGL